MKRLSFSAMLRCCGLPVSSDTDTAPLLRINTASSKQTGVFNNKTSLYQQYSDDPDGPAYWAQVPESSSCVTTPVYK